MEEGISAEEACANDVIGTQEDYERLCNEDGSVKQGPETTTYTLKNSQAEPITVNNTYIVVAAVSFAVLMSVLAVLLIRKYKK